MPQEARKSAYYNDRKIHFTAVGNDLPSNSVIDVELEGNWQQSKYGLQLAVTHFSEVQPQTTSSIKAYLCSGCIKGIGPATAAGVTAFARNQRAVYIETNVRTVFLHLLFPDEDAVPDKQLEPLVAACCPSAGEVRAWYYALLDVGAHLKSQVTNPSRRSAHYTRQSAFEGSRRQKRAELVRIVLACPGIALGQAAKRLDAEERAAGRDAVDPQLFASIVADLMREGFFREEGGKLFA